MTTERTSGSMEDAADSSAESDGASSNVCSHCTRRRFLLIGATAAVAVPVVSALSSCQSGPPPGPQTTGLTVADVAVGETREPAGANYIVGRDANGFYAYSATCTHQGCTIPAPTGGSSTCPCHGAVFDALGENLQPNRGATTRLANLDHFRVTFNGTGDSAGIIVDTSIVEPDRATRVQAPNAPAGPASDGGTVMDGSTAFVRRARARRSV